MCRHKVAWPLSLSSTLTRPTKGILPELLQRATTMKVFQIRDRMRVKPDCVYVIPPNRDVSILHGVLHLFEPAAPRGLRLPIDFLLRSLADDRQERSIGVILSGMGSDGTMGLRAIKEKGGVTLVQEPASAKFDSMPRSAIAAGLADLVAPAEELPGKIIDYLRHALAIAKRELPLEEKDHSALEKVLILLRAKTGHDFSMYKRNTIDRRIERRMGIHQIDRIGSYVRYLQENPQELELLFKELLIGVTSFFRDTAAWEQLRDSGHSCASGKSPGGRSAAGMVSRLLDRRGAIFAGHSLQGGAGTGQTHQGFHAADLWYGSGSRRHRQGPPRSLSREHCH